VGPFAHSDGHDPPRLIDEVVPGVAAVIDDVVEGFEDPVREPIFAHELPDVFLGIQFGTLSGQRDERDVGGDVQPAGEMPSGLIDEDRGVCAWRDLRGDLGQVKVHRLGVATRHDERGAFAFLRTDRAENVGRGGPLVARGAWARAALGPTAGDLVLLPDPRLVGEPEFYRAGIDALLAPDLFQACGEAFLKSSIAPAAWA